jgi:phage tail-like protein
MARAMVSDPFHAFRFVVSVTPVGGLTPFGLATAGFNSVTLPTQTQELAEYKEGSWLLRRKYPGDTTFDAVTLSRGVTSVGNEFWQWINQTSRNLEYRVDMEIKHFHRDDVQDINDFSQSTPSRVVKCFECLPTSVKAGSDMDSLSSDISLQEITVEIERFEITNVRA